MLTAVNFTLLYSSHLIKISVSIVTWFDLLLARVISKFLTSSSLLIPVTTTCVICTGKGATLLRQSTHRDIDERDWHYYTSLNESRYIL